MRVSVSRILFIVLFLTLWEGITRRGWVSQLILVPFSDIMVAGYSMFLTGEIMPHLRITFLEIVAGFLIAAGSGISIGLLLGGVKLMGDSFEPVIVALFSIPSIIIYPLFILILGVEAGSKIAFASIYAFFPVVLNSIAGMKGVNKSLIIAAVSMGASKRQIYSQVVLPSILPTIVAGLRMGLNMTIIAVVGGEILGAQEGIGYLIGWASTTFETSKLYSLILLVLVISSFCHLAMAMMERKFNRWESSIQT